MHYRFVFSHLFSYRANSYWFFVPICAPFLGAVVGVLVYQLMVGCQVEEAGAKPEERRVEAQTVKLINVTA